MKIATGNRLNEFWEELKGVLVPKSKVLKTMEEIEANTNEENVAGATALKAVNNKLAHGRVELVVNEDGTLGYKLDGADTVIPFSYPFSGSFTMAVFANFLSSASFDINAKNYKKLSLKVSRADADNGQLVLKGDSVTLGTIRSTGTFTYDISNYDKVNILVMYTGGGYSIYTGTYTVSPN